MDEYLLYLKLRAGSLLHHIRALPDQFIYAGSDCSKAKQADLDLFHPNSSFLHPVSVQYPQYSIAVLFTAMKIIIKGRIYDCIKIRR